MTTMPYGKFYGEAINSLPDWYLCWLMKTAKKAVFDAAREEFLDRWKYEPYDLYLCLRKSLRDENSPSAPKVMWWTTDDLLLMSEALMIFADVIAGLDPEKEALVQATRMRVLEERQNRKAFTEEEIERYRAALAREEVSVNHHLGMVRDRIWPPGEPQPDTWPPQPTPLETPANSISSEV
jgi:hypothetical protein